MIAQRRAFPIADLPGLRARAARAPRAAPRQHRRHAARPTRRSIGRDDLLIAASFRNYAPEVVEAAAACHKRGVPVIAFTDTPVSPLAAAAKVRFDVGDNFALPFRSLVGSMTAAQALVIAIGYAQASRQGKRRREG